MDQNKNPNRNETKDHLNIDQLLCVFSHFAVVILNVKKQHGTSFHFERNFVEIIQKGMANVYIEIRPASVAQLDAPSDWRPGGRGFNHRRGRQHSFVEIDPEIFSTVILSLPLIQEGQLSVSGERMCTILVNRLED